MKKILLIEDDTFLQDLEASKLSRGGFYVISSNRGDEALEKLKDKEICLIVLDLTIPGINGFEIIKKVRENPETKNLPIVIYSNESDQDNVKKTKELGANIFLMKSSTTTEELIESINKLINSN